MRTRQNRNIKATFETAMATPGISLVDITEPTNIEWLESFAVAFPPSALAFGAGVGWGRIAADLLPLLFTDSNLAAKAGGFSLALIVYVGVLVFYVTKTSTRYFAEKGEEDEPESQPAMIRTGASHPQHRLLSSDMRKLLWKFGRYYPDIGKFGINEWERRPARIQRSDLKRLLDYLRTINALEGSGVNRQLTEWGRGQLEKWANKQFDELEVE